MSSIGKNVSSSSLIPFTRGRPEGVVTTGAVREGREGRDETAVVIHRSNFPFLSHENLSFDGSTMGRKGQGIISVESSIEENEEEGVMLLGITVVCEDEREGGD